MEEQLPPFTQVYQIDNAIGFSYLVFWNYNTYVKLQYPPK